MLNLIVRARPVALLICVLVLGLLMTPIASGENWPGWRGPDGDGTAAGKDLPVTWSTEQNIIWKTPMPAWSGSSPIVWGDRVFVISPSTGAQDDEAAAEEGRRNRRGQKSPGGQEIILFCLDRDDGSIKWRHQLDSGNQLRMKHNDSSPSPTTDGQSVFAMTGNGIITALDFDGKVRWTFDTQEKYGRFGLGFGYGSSPVIHDGKLIVQVLHGQRTSDPSYLFALDAASGEVLWHVERPTDARSESPDAYTTPALLTHEGKTQVVILGGDYVTGHSPDTGKELWRSGGLNPRQAGNYRIVASPTVGGGMIFAPTRRVPFLALKAGGEGDITESHRAWSWEGGGAPDVPSPVVHGDRLIAVNDSGQVNVLDATTGREMLGPLETNLGTISASPVLADGKLYVVSERGETAVIRVGDDELEQLSVNQLDGSYTLSTPAVSGDRLLIRTGEFIYCIGQ